MCAIIFVSRRSTALVLFQFLKVNQICLELVSSGLFSLLLLLQEISEVDPGLNFVKPLFTTGRGAGRSNMLKESSHQRQTEVVTAFRNGVCNVLVATSVLEEGIDIPACNLIVKFDLAKTYCDYVQAKGLQHF